MRQTLFDIIDNMSNSYDHMKGIWHLRIFAFLFPVFMWIVMSQSLVMVHNSPLNRYGGFSSLNSGNYTNSTAQLHNISNGTDANFGLTYGEPNVTIFKQVADLPVLTGFFDIGLILFIIFYSLFMIGLVLLAEGQQEKSTSKFITKTLVGVLIFFCLSILLYHIDKDIAYITAANELVGVIPNLLEITPVFHMMIIFQGAILSSIVAIWTTPILPKNPYDQEVISLHIGNWKQYGSWIATLLGGIFLTTAIIFITDLSPVGKYFLRHVLVLFGGGLLLDIMFIVHKIAKLEEEFTGLRIGEERNNEILFKRQR